MPKTAKVCPSSQVKRVNSKGIKVLILGGGSAL